MRWNLISSEHFSNIWTIKSVDFKDWIKCEIPVKFMTKRNHKFKVFGDRLKAMSQYLFKQEKFPVKLCTTKAKSFHLYSEIFNFFLVVFFFMNVPKIKKPKIIIEITSNFFLKLNQLFTLLAIAFYFSSLAVLSWHHKPD